MVHGVAEADGRAFVRVLRGQRHANFPDAAFIRAVFGAMKFNVQLGRVVSEADFVVRHHAANAKTHFSAKIGIKTGQTH